ncbi:hypothetical protein FKW77_001342 [Venturia effusa]|uniref:Uncharacterized protein n=1 Tax=Venturia effusa TaxID=50376 RepID=A0A517LI32_9PEZI|nr:hypothetical protein FKW77_001342 [Venturia effusa]
MYGKFQDLHACLTVHMGTRDEGESNSLIPSSPRIAKLGTPGTIATLASDSQWTNTSSAVNARNLLIVAGASSTMLVDGFSSNGDHRAPGAECGLRANTTAEIKLAIMRRVRISPRLQIPLTVNAKTDFRDDGSTYGIAISFTVQTIRSIPAASWVGTLANWEQVTYTRSQQPKFADAL